VSLWILIIGGVGIVLGLILYGYRVMATVGTRITDLTPSRGFAATTTVVLASGKGRRAGYSPRIISSITIAAIASMGARKSDHGNGARRRSIDSVLWCSG